MADLSKTSAWAALTAHGKSLSDTSIRDLFADDDDRLSWGLVDAAGLTLDISRHQMTRDTLALLGALATEQDISGWRDRMVAGEAVNGTEHRAALHMALRGGLPKPPVLDGVNIAEVVEQTRTRFLDFAEAVRAGKQTSSTDKSFRTVIHIGIGGSDFGPRLAVDALRPYASASVDVRFVANIDAAELHRALEGADAETTLFIIASKTFTTQETVENAKSAADWLSANLPKGADVSAHFVGVTANTNAAQTFGITEERIFPMWDWVGGRFSVWSAVGLSLALAIGADNFKAFLAGAAEMDNHFLTAPLEANLPVLLGLVGVWNRNVLGCASHAVLPYDHALSLLPGYLQQLEMESNGKSVTREGTPVDGATAPAVWGAAGTTGQHAFYQWLHQGTDRASADIVLPLTSHQGPQRHHDILVAHAIAQAEALAFGRDEAATRAAMAKEGLSATNQDRLLPHRVFAGNRPVSLLTMDRLTPGTLGALLAAYEHKVFTQGILWDINPFDQWGVELGKTVAGRVLSALAGEGDLDGIDPATRHLIKAALAARSKTKSET